MKRLEWKYSRSVLTATTKHRYSAQTLNKPQIKSYIAGLHQSVEAHHRVSGPDTGRNSRGRWKKTGTYTTNKTGQSPGSVNRL